MSRATPFGQVERTLAWRYLRATRANGGVSVVSIVSFIGILLAVMALIAKFLWVHVVPACDGRLQPRVEKRVDATK